MNLPPLGTAEGFISFGRALIETEDLDPLYVGVAKATLDYDELAAFLVTYWCFYNAGFAAHSIDELTFNGGLGYWMLLDVAASGRETARAAERRHFRGDKATQAIRALWGAYPDGPKGMLATCVGAGGAATFREVSARVQKWPMFGPWIAFKAADMIDRCGYASVDDTGCSLALYDAPEKGALLLAELAGFNGGSDPVQWAVDTLLNAYGDLRAPPLYDRPLNVFEIETVLCKTKSAFGGHYHIGKDTREIRHMLERYAGNSHYAQRVFETMPAEIY